MVEIFLISVLIARTHIDLDVWFVRLYDVFTRLKTNKEKRKYLFNSPLNNNILIPNLQHL